MDGSDEWLGIDPPWCSNQALPDYWVVDATDAWRQRGLIGEVLSEVALLTYPAANVGLVRDLTGVALTLGHAEVAIALGEFESGQLTNTADTVAVVFSSHLAASYTSRSKWERHQLPAGGNH